MKYVLLISISLALFPGCSTNEETRVISEYLDNYGKSLKDFKVICFVPAEGCESCIQPTLEYSKTAGDDFLLILTSHFNKAIISVVEHYHLDLDKVIIDSKNNAVTQQLVLPTAPCYYFVDKSTIIKKADLAKTYDKSGILIEVTKFLEGKRDN